jgi:diacylglycerol kinase family enzyme
MKFLVLLNHAAGAELTKGRIADRFAAAGADADVRMFEPRALDEQIKDAAQSDIDAVIAAGENGTINAVANALASNGRKALGVLPTGGNDFLARDLGMPAELDNAVDALAVGKVTEMPVAELNGRIFLSLSTIGLHSPAKNLKLSTRGRTVAKNASAVVISSNAHQLRAIGIQPASTKEHDLLNVYVASPPQPTTFVGRWLRDTLGRSESGLGPFVHMPLPDLRVETAGRSGKLIAIIDGDAVLLRSPLVYRIRPARLRMLLPGTGVASGGA